MSSTGTNSLKNKTYEEIYGHEKAAQLKLAMSIRNKGRVVSEQQKEKARIAITGMKRSAETRRKIGLSNARRITTDATRIKMGNSHRGFKWTDESKKKRSISGMGCKNSFYGKKHNQYNIEKQRQLMTGKHPTLETRKKQSLARKGKKLGPMSEEGKQKLRDSWADPEKLKKRLSNTKRFKTNKLEKFFQDNLKNSGIGFTTHVPLPGIPDIFIDPNICIFCDGDYFHGNPLKFTENNLIGHGSHKMLVKDKWVYDKKITDRLILMDYKVLRFWETDIYNNIDKVIQDILLVKNSKAQGNEGLIVWAALVILIICVIIASAVQFIPMIFKAIAGAFHP